ncbi:MAG: metallophosphoesterase [Desulfobacteraceae bacterium]|nr:MAG: metallophosphoesterase [Desulfobacteraceae bacterium]
MKIEDKEGLRIGVLSDTHGLLRPEAVDALEGTDLIVHAGDIGDAKVLESLRALAPVAAVRGNTDRGEWTGDLPETEMVQIGNRWLYILHNFYDLDLVPEAAGISVVISGHSHKPSLRSENGVLYLNPGGAGRRRFDYPITVAILEFTEDSILPEIIKIDPAK